MQKKKKSQIGFGFAGKGKGLRLTLRLKDRYSSGWYEKELWKGACFVETRKRGPPPMGTKKDK